MTGLEVLGAVASALQLGKLCFDVQNRIRERRADHVLAIAVHKECELLITEIDKRIPALSTDTRHTVSTLRGQLVTIKSQIEARQKRNIFFKRLTILKQYGARDEKLMLLACQQYQIRASILGSLALKNGHKAIESTCGFTTDPMVLETLGSIANTLEILNTKLFEHLGPATIQELTVTIQSELQHSASNIQQTIRDTIREEFSSVRTQLPIMPLLQTGGPMADHELQLEPGNLRDFLQNLGTQDPVSDIEIWEIIWDVVETLDLFIMGISASQSTSYNTEVNKTVDVEVKVDKVVVSFDPIVGVIWTALGTNVLFIHF